MAKLTLDRVSFIWSTKKDIAFNSIKKTLSASILTYPNPSKPFIVEINASNFAIRTVLLQTQDDGLKHPMAFFSYKMILSKINYPIYEKELLAIMGAFNE